MKCIVLRGVPGVGKSTYAQTHGCAVVSADNYFSSNGEYKFNASKLPEAHGQCFRAAISVMTHGQRNLVIDNTNIQREELAPYMLLAQALGYAVEIHDCHPIGGIDSIATRNVHGVPPGRVLERYQAQLDERLPPWWKVVRVELP